MKKKNYPVIKVPSNGKPNWGEGARTLCFVYSKHQGNFILEGYLGEVKNFLKANFTHYFCYFSLWHNGRSRGYWRFWKDNMVSIFQPSKVSKHWKYRVVQYVPDGGYGFSIFNKKVNTVLEFKRLPKRWIPEFDKL